MCLYLCNIFVQKIYPIVELKFFFAFREQWKTEIEKKNNTMNDNLSKNNDTS